MINQQTKPTPADYNLSHDKFRPGQLDSINWLDNLWTNQAESTGILYAPTGSGKTLLTAAASTFGKSVALCKNKSLQSENYDKGYGAIPLYGKSNYPCIHHDALDGAMANECLYPENMYECDVASSCHYLMAKDKIKQSDYVSLNYAYWLSASWVRNQKQFPIDILTLDEAHQLSDVVLDWAGCTVNESTRRQWDLPVFPVIMGYSPVAYEWLMDSMDILKRTGKLLTSEGKNKKAIQCHRLLSKLDATAHAFAEVEDDWYVRSGGATGKFIAKPMTAKHHFNTYFGSDDRLTILMSATIGNVDTFANELGISEFNYRAVPNAWDAASRPVADIGAPRISKNTKPHEYARQAKLIADDIKAHDPSWSGVIHVNSKSQAYSLASMLSKFGLSDRIWVIPEKGTDQQLAAWNYRKKKVSNSIVVSWSFWEGIDMVTERLCYVAKVPFINIGNPYELARMKRFPQYAKLRVAQKLEQGLGRTRRGNDGDYDIDGQINGRVVIADGNWTRVKGMLSSDLRGAIVDG